jgi:hypothetical protein
VASRVLRNCQFELKDDLKDIASAGGARGILSSARFEWDLGARFRLDGRGVGSRGGCPYVGVLGSAGWGGFPFRDEILLAGWSARFASLDSRRRLSLHLLLFPFSYICFSWVALQSDAVGRPRQKLALGAPDEGVRGYTKKPGVQGQFLGALWGGE